MVVVSANKSERDHIKLEENLFTKNASEKIKEVRCTKKRMDICAEWFAFRQKTFNEKPISCFTVVK
ncbi:hypothetical protein BLX87_05975 [Bacillus sp. VT-16-64]|nr:hypothetical protein BLX87_05975 [Bacillus sp. VT-16-64]